MSGQIDQQVYEIVAKYVASDQFDPDALLCRDLSICGGDSVEFLDELEDRFQVDLRPLVERGPLERNSRLHRLFGVTPRRSGVDVSTNEVIDFIKSGRVRPVA